jgi:Protein of unknown function (DUF3224)
MNSHSEKSAQAKTTKEKFKNMNKPKIKQHLRKSFIAFAIVGALLALPKAQAHSVPANGSSTDCEHVVSQQTVGSDTVTILEITACFHGTFDGTWIGTERDVFAADGTGTVLGSGFFSGTVNGRFGTMVFTYHVSISLNGEVSHWIVDEGTGDLAGLHGHGTTPDANENGPGCPVSGFTCTDCPPATGTCDDSFTLTYTGQIDFAP